jgi:uncharacterized protein (TIGR02118 family)
MYPNSESATFNIDYYCNSHMALVRDLLGAKVKGISVDFGVGQPGSPAPFIVIGHLLFDSVEEFQSAMAAHGARLMADIANYSNVRPTIQVSEVRM